MTDVTRDLMRDYKASKERTRSEAAAGVRSFVVARNELTKESNRVRDGGMNSVAKKAIEVMKATQARKGGGKRKEEVKEGMEMVQIVLVPNRDLMDHQEVLGREGIRMRLLY